jgi:hypothetical protein
MGIDRYMGERRGKPRTASGSGTRENEHFWEAKDESQAR